MIRMKLASIAMVMSLGACTGGAADFAGSPTSGAAGGFGATQGGVQDLGLARELTASGTVPPPEAFPVEGMFSEHDLGVTGPACDRLLCLRGALGVAPTLAGEDSAWLQVGMSSTIDPERYERPSTTLIMTVDVSGSMGWSYDGADGESPTPGAVARQLLHAVGEELDSRDRVAIVTYGSHVETALPLVAGSEQDGYHAAVRALSTGGSTNMEAGLRRAYDLAEEAARDGATDETRVMLFTDVRPNVGASTASEFDRLVKRGAETGAGLTVFGLGLGLGQEVLTAIADVRGGNAFSLFDGEDVDTVMADDWPYLASPIAYDLSLTAEPGDGLEVADAYGFPGDNEVEIEASSVFLSKRKGALLLRLASADEAIGAFDVTAELRYTTPAGESVSQPLALAYDGEETDDSGRYFDQPGVEKTVALAVLTGAMRRAADSYGEAPEEAVAIVERARERFSADVASLGAEDDADLTRERELASTLLELMQERAPQDSPYGLR